MSDPTRMCEVCGASANLRDVGRGSLWQCTACSHVMRDLDLCAPRRADAWGGSGIGERVRVDRTYRRVRTLVRSARVRRVLDVGCGDGALLRRFHDDGAEVVGCDPGMLGRPLDATLDAQGALHACTLDELGDVGDFDLVLAVHVIEHLPTPNLQPLLNRVRPGGYFYAITPAADSRQIQRYGSAWWMLDDPTHVRFYSADSLARAAVAAGAQAAIIGRPRDDSLLCDGLSFSNSVSDRGVPLATAIGLAAAAPLVVRRAVSATWSPVIDVLAVRAGD